MRGALSRFAWRMWRGEAGAAGAAVRFLLMPLEGAWRLAVRARDRRYDRVGGARVDGLRVVCVGNVAVGGTGKTPVTAWVARTLEELGAKPAVLLRGYGDDEARLHRLWNPDVPVEVGVDRVAAARRAAAAGSDTAILDDGFQHRRLARDVDVVLLAAADPVPGAVLPRGPYREPLSSLRRADLVIVTRRGGGGADAAHGVERLREAGWLLDGTTTARLRLGAGDVVGLADGAPKTQAVGADGSLVLTAIARPDAFAADVEALTGSPVELLAYPDHHPFSADEAREAGIRAGRRPIFVTEKDAVKLEAHAEHLGDARVVRQRLVWEEGEEVVRRRLAAVVGASP